MDSKQMFAYVIFLAILVIIAIGISQLSDQRQAVIPIEAEFESKVVYTMSAESIDTRALQEDCRARGGQFNQCGSACAPDAETCIEVCAFTCENIPAETGASTESL